MTAIEVEWSRGLPRPLVRNKQAGSGAAIRPGSQGLAVRCKVVAPSHLFKSGSTCGRAAKRRFLQRQGLWERVESVAITLAELEAGSCQTPSASMSSRSAGEKKFLKEAVEDMGCPRSISLPEDPLM